MQPSPVRPKPGAPTGRTRPFRRPAQTRTPRPPSTTRGHPPGTREARALARRHRARPPNQAPADAPGPECPRGNPRTKCPNRDSPHQPHTTWPSGPPDRDRRGRRQSPHASWHGGEPIRTGRTSGRPPAARRSTPQRHPRAKRTNRDSPHPTAAPARQHAGAAQRPSASRRAAAKPTPTASARPDRSKCDRSRRAFESSRHGSDQGTSLRSALQPQRQHLFVIVRQSTPPRGDLEESLAHLRELSLCGLTLALISTIAQHSRGLGTHEAIPPP